MSIRRGSAAVAAVLAFAALVVPAGAQGQSSTSTPPTTTIARAKASSIEEQLRAAYDDASAAEAVALDAYKASLEKTAALDEQIAALDAELVAAAAALEDAKAKLTTAQRDLAAGEARRTEVQAQLDTERTRLDNKAVRAYVSGNARQVQLELVLGATELRSLESTQAYSAAIVDDQLDAVARVKVLEAEVTRIRDELAANERTVRETRDAIAAREAELAKKRAEVGALREAQAAETANQQTLLAQIRAKKQSYLDRLRALERESDGISGMLKAAQATQQPVLDVPKLRTPLDVALKLASPFGMRIHPIFEEPRMHAGADLGGLQGQTIRAAKAGVVVLAASQDGYGNVVVIDHGDQIATVYAHMSVVGVRFGDQVTLGQEIGKVGSTGYSTGPHLHFELRVSGAPVDPMPHIDVRTCEVLVTSVDPADQALLANRKECVVPPPAATGATSGVTTTTRR